MWKRIFRSDEEIGVVIEGYRLNMMMVDLLVSERKMIVKVKEELKNFILMMNLR